MSRGNPVLDQIHSEQMARMKKGETAQEARASMRAEISNPGSEKKNMVRKMKTPGVGN